MLLGPACQLAWAQGTISQTEPDDSIGTANATGLTAGSSGVRLAFGHSGDGPYGPAPGDGTGDMDFYRVSAASGQKIFVNINNAGIDPDFDSYVGLYDSGGNLVAENDDKGDTSRGYDRTSKLTFTVAAAGDYYVCVSNWIGDVNLPSDPFTPGQAPGPPAGKAGPYQLFIGLDTAAPVPQFVGGSTGYPVPAFLPSKVLGTPRYDGQLTLKNTTTGTGAASDYVITAYNITGADAARFNVVGLTPPVTIAPGAELTVTVSFNSAGSEGLAKAVLNLTSNDPFSQNFVMDTYGSPVVGGGTFAAKQVAAAAGITVNSFDVADALLAGTQTGTAYTSVAGAVNFGVGADGHFGSDLNFPIGATPGDNFVLQVTGPFFIREAGMHTFLGYSDDGQRLRIDGDELINFTGYNTDQFAPVELTAGMHTLEYTMYEGGGGNHAELLISKQRGEFHNYIDSTWELLEAFSADADGDGMPNDYELANGTNPDVADADVDLDSDGLTNIQEYNAGTKPTVADTDGDGLKDGVETKTGIWVSVTNTGTNPLVADTDGDGLLDGVENPELPTIGATQPGTDPNKKDTDGDGFADFSEVVLGTDPKVASSVPALVFQPVLKEDFDTPGFHSRYSFNSLNATTSFVAGVFDSDVTSHGAVARLTDYQTSSHNSLTWDYVDIASSPVVRISFDYRIGANNADPADGLGIGLFRKSVYGTSGPSSGIVDAKAWENPTGAAGYGDALWFGLGVYGADVIRVTGPAAPAVPAATVNPAFNLAPLVDPVNPYNRGIITVITNGPDASMVKMEIIQDVDGAATRSVIFDNVLVPGFRIASEDFRLIAGARTGGSVSQVDIDNVSISIPQQPTPSLALSNTFTSFLADIYDGSAAAVDPISVTVTLNGAPVAVTPVKTGNLTTVSYTGMDGGFFPSGTNTLVFNYSSTTGTAYSDTRTFQSGPYLILPASLAVPVTAAGNPGFNVRTVQKDPLVVGEIAPSRLAFWESVLAGAVTGSPFKPGNLADTTGSTNGYFHSGVINFEQDGVSFGFFPDDLLVPGIPGTTLSTDNYVLEALTWVEFPSVGVYKMGITADDGFRVSLSHAPVPGVSIVAPAASARILAVAPSIESDNGGGISGPFANPPVTAKVVAAVPADATTALTNPAAIAGNIALIDRGTNPFAAKIKFAQDAGAIGVIIINQNNPDSVPIAMGGDAPAVSGVTIPAVMVSKFDGDALKALLGSPGGLEVTFGTDESTTLGKANINQTTTFEAAVTTPGLYPLRLINFEGGGGASVEWYSFDSEGGRHLLNDASDELSLNAYSSLASGGAPMISVDRSGGAIIINYTGVLQSSSTLSGFSDVTGATSPYSVPAGSPAKMFFRARN